jgi:NADPH2:quinone reductase
LAKLWGAGRVIGLASSPEKRDLVLSLGADVALDSNDSDLKAAVRAANDGRGADIVLEMAGGAAGDALLSSLGAFGRFITFGMASRQPMSDIAPGSLMIGSRTVSGFWLMDCMRPERIMSMVAEPLAALLDLVSTGQLTPVESAAFNLETAADAHRALLARTTTGKVILTMH